MPIVLRWASSNVFVTYSHIMNEDRAIMKREITINTLVACGFAARPPSLVRFILPRWGKSFVCSTLPSSILTERTVPQEFPRPFIRDSFVRYCELSYPRYLPTLQFNPCTPASIPLSPPSRRWRLLDKISSLSHRESHWLPPFTPSCTSCFQDTS